MSAQDEGGRDPPKPKGKTLGSFLGSLPGFSSARNLVASAHSSAREVRPLADPAGASPQPQAQATNLEQTAGGEKQPPPSDKMTSGAKDLVSSKMSKTKDTISSGMANVVDTATGVVHGGLGMTRSALSGAKETVASGVTGAVGVAKGTVQTGLDTSKTFLTGTKDTLSTGLTGALGMAKGTVQTGLDTSKTVLTGTKDTVCSGVTGAMNVAKGAVQTSLDTSKTVLTGTKDTLSTGLTGALGMAKGTVQTGLETTKNIVTGTKDTVSAGVTGAVTMAKGTVQTGLDTTKNIVTGTKDTVSAGVTGAGNVVKGAVQTGLGTIQNWLPGTRDSVWGGLTSSSAPRKGGEALSPGVSSAPDTLGAGLDLVREATAEATRPQGATLGREDAGRVAPAHGHEGPTSFATLRDELRELGDVFQPLDAEEQAQLAASEPEPRVLTADERSYFVRLGDLAPGFRQRAFEHALSHLQHGQFQARAALAQLEDAFKLIQKAERAPESQSPPDQGPSSRAEEGATQEVPDAGALSRACSLIQQLHVAYSSLASGLQGLPEELQQRVGRARHSLCELYGLVSSASSVQQLPAERLARSHEGVGRAWQELEQVLDSVQHGPPLCWLVGPFALPPGGQRL
ncbi:perilipin-4 isoform X3 [Herpailurus yagouaroundi]|uniref:perilipin-4 isoform X3 n=1 Tax=Herpailurus yagouaroundi TaxID=1608482 RepID=UPI001AD7404C|nr:perilipin-4 isoform X3 [Puma yagouaroundi]